MTGSAIEVVHGEVVTPGDERLRELAEIFNREHEAMVGAVRVAIDHAVRAGEALIEAKQLVPPGQWGKWLDAVTPNDKRRSACGKLHAPRRVQGVP